MLDMTLNAYALIRTPGMAAFCEGQHITSLIPIMRPDGQEMSYSVQIDTGEAEAYAVLPGSTRVTVREDGGSAP